MGNRRRRPREFLLLTPTTSNEYLISQPHVAGNTIFVSWSAVDSGTGVMDWSTVESAVAPWWAAKKKTGLILWALADISGVVATLAYVLKQLPATLSCSGAGGYSKMFRSSHHRRLNPPIRLSSSRSSRNMGMISESRIYA